jgi:hypothetical protein
VDAAAAQRLQGNLALAIFGVLLIVVMIVAPGGVQGLLRRIGRLLRRRREPGQYAQHSAPAELSAGDPEQREVGATP